MTEIGATPDELAALIVRFANLENYVAQLQLRIEKLERERRQLDYKEPGR